MSSNLPTGRTLGIDLGSKRIGIAVSDGRQTLASPVGVLQRSGNTEADHRALAKFVNEEEAVVAVVGVPVALSGKTDIAAKAVLEELELLRLRLPVPVDTWDERMSSAVAHKHLKAQGLSEKKRREQIDKWAAVEILQGWLDHQTGLRSRADEMRRTSE